jgi:hypothetical protein
MTASPPPLPGGGSRRSLEWAPWAGQIVDNELTRQAGLRRMKAMANHRTHSIEFKRQVAQECQSAL